MNWFFYALIGGVAGWLVAWATDKTGSKMVKPISIGAAGALAGGGAIFFLISFFKALAPMVGAALGSLALLQFVSKRSSEKLVAKK
jgi:uncharacterized membrane protein YeaQ/YmgE (transglycosylase-associated protein family)